MTARDWIIWFLFVLMATGVLWYYTNEPRHILSEDQVAIVRLGAEQYGAAFNTELVSIPGVDSNYNGYANAVVKERGTGTEIDLVCNYTRQPGCRRAAAAVN